MLRLHSRCLLLTILFTSASAVSAWAGPVTGNPAADGWVFGGNSLSQGTFVYTYFGNAPKDLDHVFDFDVYSTSFTLESGSALLGSNWQAGDLIVGIGATVAKTAVLNANVRILAKYGADDATFAASSFAPSGSIPPQPWSPANPENANFYGDGAGSSSKSGTGGVIIETPQIWGTNPPTSPWFNTTDEGNVVLLDGSPRPDSTGKVASVTLRNPTTILTSDGVAKVIYQLDNPGTLLSSFETYLNLSLLERNGIYTHPNPGDKFVLAIQNVADAFTKATGTTPPPVPEPSSIVLAAMGLGGLGLTYLRRHRRTIA